MARRPEWPSQVRKPTPNRPPDSGRNQGAKHVEVGPLGNSSPFRLHVHFHCDLSTLTLRPAWRSSWASSHLPTPCSITSPRTRPSTTIAVSSEMHFALASLFVYGAVSTTLCKYVFCYPGCSKTMGDTMVLDDPSGSGARAEPLNLPHVFRALGGRTHTGMCKTIFAETLCNHRVWHYGCYRTI